MKMALKNVSELQYVFFFTAFRVVENNYTLFHTLEESSAILLRKMVRSEPAKAAIFCTATSLPHLSPSSPLPPPGLRTVI
jgi:hypothetical protein